MSSRRTPAHQAAVIDRRGGNAATAIPSRKVRRQSTRRDAVRAAIREESHR